MTTAKHRYNWKPMEIILPLILLAAAGGVLYVGLTNPEALALPTAIVFAAALFIMAVGPVFYANKLKKNSTLRAEMNPETGDATFWMHRPNKALWGTKLEKLRNTGNLNDIVALKYEEVRTTPVNRVLVVQLDSKNEDHLHAAKPLYIPARLATKPAVQDFLRTYIEKKGAGAASLFADQETRRNYEEIVNNGSPFNI